MQRKLIIFDLDETLVHATATELSRAADFQVPPYFVYIRPYVSDLLASLAVHYDFAVWSSSSQEYVDAVIAQLFGNQFEIKFAWSVGRCIQRVDARSNGYVYVKDLRKVQSQGYLLEHITIIDDSPEKISRQPRNHLKVKPFYGQPDDDELLSIVEILFQRDRFQKE